MNEKVIRFVSIAYLLAWAIWLIPILRMNGRYELNEEFSPFLLAGSFSPTIAALICRYIDKKWTGVQTLLNQVIRFKFPFKVYVVCLFVLPILAALSYLMLQIKAINLDENILLYVTMIIAPLNGLLGILSGVGPLGEELGWRGYLQPIISKKKNDFQAAIIIGLIWAFWHLPIFLFPEWRNGLDLPTFIILYPISTIFLAFMMTKVWRWSRMSVFLCMWFHGLINALLGIMSNRRAFNFEEYSDLSIYLLILSFLLVGCFTFEIIDRKIMKTTTNTVYRK
ncbi:MAG: CPBP family intramembrane metalloprotease [Bacteroidetes bacterium]|nr:MAG: CPBP family intramembrane metalloprotease [Bacteroidota bacterium]REK54692.1 MAG: CPBP family intramembrane metalloprotease [Bacteroidota bacterium]